MSFLMSSLALRRSPAANLEATMPPGPTKNPLEEFADLMGVDVSALERFGGAAGLVPTPGAPHEPAAPQMVSSPTLHEDAMSVHGFNIISGATEVDDLYRPAEMSIVAAAQTSRRSRLPMLAVLVAVGVAGCVGAWAINGAPGARTSAGEAGAGLEALPIDQKTAALRGDSISSLPEDQTNKPGIVGPESIENQPSVSEEQTKSPTTTPSSAATLTPTDAALSDMPAAAPVSASAAPPVTRSIAPSSSTAERTQVLAPAETPLTAQVVSPEPKPLKVVSVHSDGSVSPSGEGTSSGVNSSLPPLAAQISPTPTTLVTPLLNPPTPIARPSFDASAGGSLKPVKKRLDAPPAPSADSADHKPVASIDASALTPPVNVAADSGGGGFTAKSALQFVPNLYEKAASALSGSPPETPVVANDPATPQSATAAAAPGGGKFSADSVLQFVPNLYETAASALHGSPPETKVAAADPKPAEVGDRGAYGVQFAAPTTEQAARRASARLRSKFAIELGGLQPTVRQAEVRGREVYQVGIGGMSKADAEALCLRLKSSSGNAICLVAPN
jgi:hypothetical protein